KNSLSPQLHDERGIGRRGNAAGGEVRHRKPALAGNPADQLEGGAHFFGFTHQFLFRQGGQHFDLANNGADVPHSFHHVAGTGFSFSADQGGAFGDAAQRFAQIPRSADKGHLKEVLVDVVFLIGRRQHFTLVDVVHFQRL